MLFEKHLEALQVKLEKHLPNYSPAICMVKDAQGIVHAEYSQCLQGNSSEEAPEECSIEDIVTFSQKAILCPKCRATLHAEGCYLVSLDRYIDEFLQLEKVVSADINPSNVFEVYTFLKGYSKTTDSYILNNKPFAAEVKNWSVGILAQAHALFAKLKEDIPGSLSSEIAVDVFNRVFAVPASWSRFSSEAQKAAQEGLRQAAFELSQDQRLFVTKTELFSESSLGYHPLLSLDRKSVV